MKKISFTFFIYASLLLFASIYQANAENLNHDFLRGITLLQKGDKSNGYKTLERVFLSAKVEGKSETLKQQAALMLAFASNKDLKLKKRHQYAEETLNSKNLTISEKDSNSLLRIAGDGYFEDANFEKAETYFKKMEKSTDPDSIAYAAYKRGWIYLNQGKADEAFALWYDDLFKNEIQMSADLKLAMIQDLGRAWAESKKDLNSIQRKVLSLKISDEEENKFIDGIALGVRRFQDSKIQEDFRSRLYQTRFALPVFHKTLDDGFSFKYQPCDLLGWLNTPISNSDLSDKSEKIVPYLNQCYKAVIDSKEKNISSKVATNLLEVSKRFDFKSVARWARAELFIKQKNFELACIEYLKMNIEFVTEMKTAGFSGPTGMLESLFHSCEKIQTTDTVPLFADLVQIFSEKKLLTEDSHHPVYELTRIFLQSNKFKSQILDLILSDSKTYRPTLIPMLVAEKIITSPEEKSKSILDKFADAPILEKNQIWYSLLKTVLLEKIKNKNYSDALNTLKQFRPDSPDLWIYWSLSIPDSETQYESEIAENIAKYSGNISKLSPDQKQSVFMLLTRTNHLDQILSNWKSFSTVQEDSLSAFFEKLFENLILGKTEITNQLLSDKRIRLTMEASQIAKEKKIEALKKYTGKVTIEKMNVQFLSDLNFSAQLFKSGRESNKKQFKFSPKIAKEIELSFKNLKNQIDSVQKRKWSRVEWFELSKSILVENCELLKGRLAHIKKPSWLQKEHEEQLKQQLSPLFDTLEDWKKSLQAPIQAGTL